MHGEQQNISKLMRSGSVDKRLFNDNFDLAIPRKNAIGLVMVIALLAFEIFNFDTTRYALQDLLGPVSFLSLPWATVLAIAFCAIDFAGLARIFTPQRGKEEPHAVWYLMGAWILGATMNAIMTWWAVSLTLLTHDFGNEVLSRAQLLTAVPLFVATLVWLTRILFIGAFAVAGEHLFDLAGVRSQQGAARSTDGLQLVKNSRPSRRRPALQTQQSPQRERPSGRPASRIRQRPSTPSGVHRMPAPMQARGRRR